MYTNKLIWDRYGKYDYMVTVSFHEHSEEYNNIEQSVTGIFTFKNVDRTNPIIDEDKPIKFEVLQYPFDENAKNFAWHEGIKSTSISNIFSNDEWLNSAKRDINLPKQLPRPLNLELNFSEEENEDASNLRLLDYYKDFLNQNGYLIDYENHLFAALMLQYRSEDIDDSFREKFILDEEINKIKWQVRYFRYLYTDFELTKDERSEILDKYAKYRIGLLEKELSGVAKEVRISKENSLNYLSLRKLAIHFETEFFCSEPAIYLDIEGVLHIYVRHEASLKKIKYPTEKTEFNYSGKDIVLLLKHIINENFVSEFKRHKTEKPNNNYRKTIPYNGDRYKIGISKEGKINEFHRL